jgi:hypothetical protein
MYPVPPQRGQSFGSTSSPSIANEFFTDLHSRRQKVNLVTKREHGNVNIRKHLRTEPVKAHHPKRGKM